MLDRCLVGRASSEPTWGIGSRDADVAVVLVQLSRSHGEVVYVDSSRFQSGPFTVLSDEELWIGNAVNERSGGFIGLRRADGRTIRFCHA